MFVHINVRACLHIYVYTRLRVSVFVCLQVCVFMHTRVPQKYFLFFLLPNFTAFSV